MQRFFRAAAAASVLALAVPASGAGAAAIAAEALAETTRLPFQPPIDAPIRYRLTQSKSAGGRPATTASLVYSYRFERNGDAFRLTVTPEKADMMDFDRMPMSAATRERLAAFSKMPLVILLSRDAEVAGIANEAAYLGAFRGWIDALAAEMEKISDPQQREMAKPAVEMLRSLPAEAWVARLLENVQPVLEFAATELAKGEALTGDVEMDGPGGETVTQHLSYTLEKVAAGTAEISLRSEADPEQLTATFKPLFAQIRAAAPDQGADPFGELVSVTRQTRGTYRVSTTDGLLDSFRSEETLELKGSGGSEKTVETKTIERLR